MLYIIRYFGYLGQMPYNDFMDKKKWIIPAIILSVLAVNLVFGLPRLSRFSAVDEPYWTYGRTPKFWKAVSEQKWKSTNINDKPGITAAIISKPWPRLKLSER